MDAAFLFPAFGHTQHFTEAAAEAGLRKIVLPSSGAVSDAEDSVIKTMHAEIEEQATASGMPTVRVCPTVFVANDLAWLLVIKSGIPVPLAYPEAAMPAVAEQDIASVVATCLTQHVDRDTHEVTGPRSLTQLERLEILTKHTTGGPAHWTDITDDAERNGLPDIPGPPGAYLLKNLARASEEPFPPKGDVRQVLGRDAIDYPTWVAEAAEWPLDGQHRTATHHCQSRDADAWSTGAQTRPISHVTPEMEIPRALRIEVGQPPPPRETRSPRSVIGPVVGRAGFGPVSRVGCRVSSHR